MATVAVLVGLVIGTVVAWILGDAHFDAVATPSWFGVHHAVLLRHPKFSIDRDHLDDRRHADHRRGDHR